MIAVFHRLVVFALDLLLLVCVQWARKDNGVSWYTCFGKPNALESAAAHI